MNGIITSEVRINSLGPMDRLLKRSCRRKPWEWFPWSTWSVSCSCRSNWFPQMENAGGFLGSYPVPQPGRHPALSFHSTSSGWLGSLAVRIRGQLTWQDPSVGTVLEMLASCRWLRAGNLCTGLCAVWATGLGLLLVLAKSGLATGLLPSHLNFFSTFRGLTEGMKWKFNLI